MVMSDEQKREAGERLRLGRERAAAARAVSAATPEQILEASTKGQVEVTNEDLFAMQQSGADGRPAAVATRAPEHQGGNVAHSTSAKVRVYKPTPQGYMPRTIPASNLPNALRNGWKAACPDCGRADCSIDGNLNDCTGREPRLLRRCPIVSCRKRIWDTYGAGLEVLAEPDDPFEIKDDVLGAASTPEERTRGGLRVHMLAYHPQEAPQYGFYQQTAPPPVLGAQVGANVGVR